MPKDKTDDEQKLTYKQERNRARNLDPLSDERFIIAWNHPNNVCLEDVADKVGKTKKYCSDRAFLMKRAGITGLRTFTRYGLANSSRKDIERLSKLAVDTANCKKDKQ